MDSSSSRRPLCDLLGIGDDDLEEGEYVPGDYHQSSSDTDHDDRFDHQPSRREDDEVHPQHQHGGRMRRLEDIVAVGRRAVGAPLPPSPTPSSESEGTISDHRSASSAGAVGGGGDVPARKLACHVCGKGFRSRKAVDGHMRVHGSGSGRHVVAAAAAFSAGWAATGRRGWTGGKPTASAAAAAAASLNSESTGHSTAIVAAQPCLEAVPMAFAMTNLSPMPSSTRTNLSGGEDDEGSSASAAASAQPTMHYDEPVAAVAATVVIAGANPSSTGAEAGVRAGPVDHQLAAANQAPPQVQVHRQAVAVPPPAAQKAHFAQLQPLVPPPTAAVQLQQQGQLVVPQQPAEPPREYSCKVCGKTYSTHQGLGGHAAGHRNRQREQEAMAAAAGMMMLPHGGGGGGEFLAALRRGRKAEAPHACQKCHKVFATGVALGGHMRMHYTGPPIVHKGKKRCVALVAVPPPPPPPAVTEADLRLALSTKTEEPSSSPAPAVAGTGRLRLFGIDIGPLLQQAPSSEQQGSGTTEGSSSAGEQQRK